MTAQEIKESALAIVYAEEYFDLRMDSDGWLLVGRHAWQILMMRPCDFGRYVVHVWHPVSNRVKRAVVTAYVNVWITPQSDERL